MITFNKLFISVKANYSVSIIRETMRERQRIMKEVHEILESNRLSDFNKQFINIKTNYSLSIYNRR